MFIFSEAAFKTYKNIPFDTSPKIFFLRRLCEAVVFFWRKISTRDAERPAGRLFFQYEFFFSLREGRGFGLGELRCGLYFDFKFLGGSIVGIFGTTLKR